MPCHAFPSLPFPSLPFPSLTSLQYTLPVLPCLDTIGEDDRAADIHVVTSSNGHRGLLNAGSQSDQRVKAGQAGGNRSLKLQRQQSW